MSKYDLPKPDKDWFGWQKFYYSHRRIFYPNWAGEDYDSIVEDGVISEIASDWFVTCGRYQFAIARNATSRRFAIAMRRVNSMNAMALTGWISITPYNESIERVKASFKGMWPSIIAMNEAIR